VRHQGVTRERWKLSGCLGRENGGPGNIPVATLRPDGLGGIEVYYVHTDHLNTPRRVTRPVDDIAVWRWDSDPFGTTAANEDPDGDLESFVYNLRFPGQYLDDETGLAYNYFRDYDPVTGRYIQSDPIGLDGGLNTYLYANAKPLRYTDPDGRQPGAIAFPGFGGGAAAAEGAAGAGAAGGLGAFGPAAAVAGAGLAGYGLGSLIYPHIAIPLGNAVDAICSTDSDEREAQCDYQYYQVDIPVCRGITRTRGPQAAQRCYASAAQRYAACLAGRPMPPLDTYNNRISINGRF
jgi:RHS repeat-associated protein